MAETNRMIARTAGDLGDRLRSRHPAIDRLRRPGDILKPGNIFKPGNILKPGNVLKPGDIIDPSGITPDPDGGLPDDPFSIPKIPKIPRFPKIPKRPPIVLDDTFLPGGVLKDDVLIDLSDKFGTVQGKPRGDFDVPISPTRKVTASTLFEAPDPASPTRYYLPQLKLAEHDVDGVRQVRAELAPSGDSWVLTVALSEHPRRGGTDVMPDRVYSPRLRFVPPTTGAVKELRLVPAPAGDGTWTASLTMTELTERDEVVHALTTPEYQTQLVVSCTFTAAIPLDQNSGRDNLTYRSSRQRVDLVADRDPFVFDRDLHPYVFSSVTGVGDQMFGFVLHPIEWDGRTHYYYQDEARPYVFYYFPDAFKATRRPTPPHTPNLRVRFQSEAGTLEDMRASLEYVATPVVELDRLEEASASLAVHLPETMPPEIAEPVFEPYLPWNPDQLRLLVQFPRAGSSGAALQERPEVVANLTDPFSDELTDLTMAGFQNVFDALFGASAVMLSGRVEIGGDGERPTTMVPFAARLDDLYGPALTVTETVSSDGTIHVAVRNGTESRVLVRSLPVQLVTNEQIVGATIADLAMDGETAELPVELAAEQELAFRAVPPDGTDLAGAVRAIVGQDDLELLSDPEAVWDVILDPSLPAEYTRVIKVLGVPEMFAPTTDVTRIVIDFDNGDHVVLTPDHLEAEAGVRVPLRDLVLHRAQDSEYGYTQIILRGAAQTREHKSDTLSVLLPEVSG